MATITQVKTGLVKYIDNEILPKLTGARKLGLGVYTALAAENLEKTIMQYAGTPAIAMLEVIDTNGNINVSKLYSAASPYFTANDRYIITIPLIGDFTINRDDMEKLYKYILE